MKTNPQHKSLRAISASCAVLLALGALINIGFAPMAHAETLTVVTGTNTNDPVVNELQMKGIALSGTTSAAQIASVASKTDLYNAIQAATSEFPGDGDLIVASVFAARPGDVNIVANTAFLKGVVAAAVKGVQGTDISGVYNTTTINAIALAAANQIAPGLYIATSGSAALKEKAVGNAIGDIAQAAIAGAPMPSTDAVTIATYLAANVTGLTLIEKGQLAGHSIKSFAVGLQPANAAAIASAVGAGFTTVVQKETFAVAVLKDVTSASGCAEQVAGAVALLGGSITNADAHTFNRFIIADSALGTSVIAVTKALATIAIGTNGENAVTYATLVTGTGTGITDATRTSVAGGVSGAAPTAAVAVAHYIAGTVGNTDTAKGGVYAASAKSVTSTPATVLSLSQDMYSTYGGTLLTTDLKRTTFAKNLVIAAQANNTSVANIIGDTELHLSYATQSDMKLFANTIIGGITTNLTAIQAVAKKVAQDARVTNFVTFATDLSNLNTQPVVRGAEAAGIASRSPADAVTITTNIATGYTNTTVQNQNDGRSAIISAISISVSGSFAAIVNAGADLIVDLTNVPTTNTVFIGRYAGKLALADSASAATIATTLDTHFTYTSVADESTLAGKMVSFIPANPTAIQGVVQALIDPGFSLADKETYTQTVAGFATIASLDVSKAVAATLADDATRQTFAVGLAALTPSGINVDKLMGGVAQALTSGTNASALAQAITAQLKSTSTVTKVPNIIGAITAAVPAQAANIVSLAGGVFVTGSNTVANVTSEVTNIKGIAKYAAAAAPTFAATIASTAIALIPATVGAGSGTTVDKNNKATVAANVIGAFVTSGGVVTNQTQIINVVIATGFGNVGDDTLYAIKIGIVTAGAAGVVTNQLATNNSLSGSALEAFTKNVIVGAAGAAVNIAYGATQRAITNSQNPVTFASNVTKLFTTAQSAMVASEAAGVAKASPNDTAAIIDGVLNATVSGTSTLVVNTDTNRIALAKKVAQTVPLQSSTIAFQAAGHLALSSYAALGNAIASGVMTLITPAANIQDDLGAIAAVLVLKARQNTGTDTDVANIIAQIVKAKPAAAYDIVGAGLAAANFYNSGTAGAALQTAISNAITGLGLTTIPSGSVAGAMSNFTSGQDRFVDVTYADGALIPHVTVVHPS